MKNKIKRLLRENSLVHEDYPSSWNIETFKSLNSFAKRIKYCQDNLIRLSSGSSRIVYKIDDEKVLKLAKNSKGIAQNQVEIEYGNDSFLGGIVANTFESDDENYLWVEMELARKLTESLFKKIVGIDFQTYCNLLAIYNNKSSRKQMWAKSVDEKTIEASWENEFIYEIYQLIGSYDFNVYDLQKLNSYGVVKRDGLDTIVVIDYGLNDEVASKHYS